MSMYIEDEKPQRPNDIVKDRVNKKEKKWDTYPLHIKHIWCDFQKQRSEAGVAHRRGYVYFGKIEHEFADLPDQVMKGNHIALWRDEDNDIMWRYYVPVGADFLADPVENYQELMEELSGQDDL